MSVSISADGSYIAASSGDNKVYLFGRVDNTLLWSYETTGWVTSVSISSDGSYIAASGYDFRYEPWGGNVYFFSRSENTPIWWYGSVAAAPPISMSSDGNYLAVVSSGLLLFGRENNTPLRVYTRRQPWEPPSLLPGDIVATSISSDSSFIAAGEGWIGGKNVYLYNRDNDTPLRKYGTDGEVKYVSISSDGSYIAAGVDALWDKVYLFSRSDNTPMWSYTIESVWSLAISSNGNYIVAGTAFPDFKIYLFGRELSTGPAAAPTFPTMPVIAIVLVVAGVIGAILAKRKK